MSNGQAIALVENVTTSNGSTFQYSGGTAIFMAEATWGGGSVKLQLRSPNGTWIDYPSGSLSANGSIIVYLPPGQVRAVVATATAAYAYLIATR